jgi:hypothetical protein
LYLKAIRETREWRMIGGNVGEEVEDLVGEGVLVANNVARWPPGGHVRVAVTFCHHYPAKSGLGWWQLVIMKVEDVHVLKIKFD